jgi:tetratricopeptide (TPR) repeat protein
VEPARQRSGGRNQPPHSSNAKTRSKKRRSQDWQFRIPKDRLWLGIVVLVALVVRLVVVWELYKGNPGFFSLDVDSQWHFLWAKELAAGNWLGTDIFYRAPLYPYLLGLWFTVFGDNLLLVRIVQAFMGAISAGLAGLLGWRVFGRRVGITAGLIWAFYGPMIYYETEILIPVLAIPLNILAIWLAFGRRQKKSHGIWPWLGIGAIIGISAIARPNILIVGPVFLWLAWMASRPNGNERTPVSRRLPALVALLIGILLPILPVTARNYIVGNEPVLIAYQGGVNLYIGNNPDADGLTMQMPEVVLEPTVGWDEFVGTTDSIARAESGLPLTPSEISGHWSGKAFEYMKDNPLSTLKVWLRKAYYLFNGFEAGDQTDIYDFTRFSKLLGVLIWSGPIYFPFGLIVPFALLGIGWAWTRAPGSRPLIAFVLLYSISVVLFLATARHRLPILPLMIAFAAAGFWWLLDLWREQRGKYLAMAAAIVVTLGILLNLPTVERILHNPAFTLYQEALVYDRLGEYQKAAELYARAVDEQPLFMAARRNLALDLVRTGKYALAEQIAFSYLRTHQHDAEAINNLGRAYLGMEDTTKAMGSFRIAMRENPKLGQPHLNMGNIALARGEAVEAAACYQRAIAADSSFGAAYNALGVLFARGGLPDTAIATLHLCTEKNPSYPSAWLNLGNVLLETEQYTEAIEAMSKALELQPNLPGAQYNLALAYAKTGDVEKATRQLDLLLKTDPNHVQGRELLKTIQDASK